MIRRLILAAAGVGLLASAASASTFTVNNNASLKALAAGQAHVVKRLGYAAPGDGGAAEYVWNGASACTDDGGSCIAPNVGAGRWILSDPKLGTPVDVRIFGAVADDSATDAAANTTAINNAIVYAATNHAMAFVPQVATPFRVNTITLNSRRGGLTGPTGAGSVVYGGDPNIGCQLHFVDQAVGLDAEAYTTQVSNISICGNAAESTSATETIGLKWAGGRVEGNFQNITIADFVVGVEDGGSRSTFDHIRVDDQTLYPNYINGYPRACFRLAGGNSYSTSVETLTHILCRFQSWHSETAANGDGVTSWWDVTKNAGGFELFRADAIKALIGVYTPLQNGQSLEDMPEDKCGMSSTDGDYTIWDITASGGAGTGGTQLFCTQTIANVTSGNPQITVASTTGYQAGTHILVDASHGIPLNTTVVSIDDATHLTLSNAPYITTDYLPIVLTQKDIKTSGAGGVTVEVRFNAGSIPPVGTQNVHILWQDPTASACFEVSNASDFINISAVMLTGCDVVLKHTGNTDGGVSLSMNYNESDNSIAEVLEGYGDEITTHRVVNPIIHGTTPNSFGGHIAPWWIDPAAGPTKITYNDHTYLYNGASNGENVLAPATGHYYKADPQADGSGHGLVPATNSVYCSPLVTKSPWSPNALAFYAQAAGTAAVAKLGYYSSDPVTGLPGIRLGNGNVTAIGVGANEASLQGTARINSPGLYWVCSIWNWTAAPDVNDIAVTNTGSSATAIFGDSSLTSLTGSSQKTGVIATGGGITYSGGLPTSLVGLTAPLAASGTVVPYIVWKSN